MLMMPASAASAHDCHPGAIPLKNPPRNFRYTLRAMNPKNCMKKRGRYAPTRRDANRAAKSAAPQHTAPVSPRMMASDSCKEGELPFLRLKPEDRHYFLQILPDFAFRSRVAKQIRRMIGGD